MTESPAFGGLEQAMIGALNIPARGQDDDRNLYKLRLTREIITILKPLPPHYPVFTRQDFHHDLRIRHSDLFYDYKDFKQIRMSQVLHYSIQGRNTRKKRWFIDGTAKEFGSDVTDFIMEYINYNPTSWSTKKILKTLPRFERVEPHYVALGKLANESGVDKNIIREFVSQGYISSPASAFTQADAYDLYHLLVQEGRAGNALKLLGYLKPDKELNVVQILTS